MHPLLQAILWAYFAINILIMIDYMSSPEFAEDTKDWHWSEHFVEQLIMVCFALLIEISCTIADNKDDDEPKS